MTTETQPGYSLEIIRDDFPRGDFRAAVFDFDGTLSLLRRNWQDVMIPMMVDVLAATGTSESPDELYGVVEEFVMRLNGKQTIYQMIELSKEVEKRGVQPQDPLQYKHRYHGLLLEQVGPRIEAIRSGELLAEEMTVPGATEILSYLSQRSIELYLASGTDLKYVRDEVALLGLEHFFGPRIYGALDDFRKFSKAMIIQQIIADTNVSGSQLIGFGDGFVEIEEVKKVGGLTIGVASDEVKRQGINAWKRERLISAGADIIIGNYRHLHRLTEAIGLS